MNDSTHSAKMEEQFQKIWESVTIPPAPHQMQSTHDRYERDRSFANHWFLRGADQGFAVQMTWESELQMTIDNQKKAIADLNEELDLSVKLREGIESDVQAMEREVSKVYCHITDNKFSKPNTTAEYVIEEADKRPCPHISTSSEGTSHCELAERDGQFFQKTIAALAEKSQNSVNISVAHIQENERLRELLILARDHLLSGKYEIATTILDRAFFSVKLNPKE